ncbi:hypothetical protein BHM03_00007291 [Ensete ventricosum]|nr:hypothetical protein BHM03_00007291 [Ensete ventricosum]
MLSYSAFPHAAHRLGPPVGPILNSGRSRRAVGRVTSIAWGINAYHRGVRTRSSPRGSQRSTKATCNVRQAFALLHQRNLALNLCATGCLKRTEVGRGGGETNLDWVEQDQVDGGLDRHLDDGGFSNHDEVGGRGDRLGRKMVASKMKPGSRSAKPASSRIATGSERFNRSRIHVTAEDRPDRLVQGLTFERRESREEQEGDGV